MEPPSTTPPTRRRGPLLLAGLAALVILGGVAIVIATSGDDSADDVDRFRFPGDQAEAPPPVTSVSDAPTDEFEYWDGTKGSLADFAGTPVVLNFFASWCAPCVDEMPAFEDVHQQLGDAVRFVGVNRPERRPADAERIIEQTGITYEVVRDTGPLLPSLEGLVMPTTVLITADGQVVRLHSGPMDAAQLRIAIDEELLS